MEELIKWTLQYAKEHSIDGFNALSCGQNLSFFKELKFLPGDGNLNFYMYNWQFSTKALKNDQVYAPMI